MKMPFFLWDMNLFLKYNLYDIHLYKWDGGTMWHAYARRVVHADLWWENLWEKDNLKYLYVDGGQY